MLEIAKGTNEAFYSHMAHQVSESKLVALGKKLTGNTLAKELRSLTLNCGVLWTVSK
jgi:hypothetical protein